MAVSSSGEASAFAHPQIRRLLKTGSGDHDDSENVCWVTKFWPYGPTHSDPVFCLSNRWDMLVCRIRGAGEGTDVEVVRHFETIQPEEEGRDRKQDQIEEQYCACAWGYLEEDKPLLLGAGDFGYIRVFDIVEGTLLTTLVGHGKGVINELATHPKYPWICASASVDQSIRIWDLRRCNNKRQSPTVIICGAGNGHRESVLTVAWHDSGRYLVSGAFDNTICVWTIPDLDPKSSFWDEISPEQTRRRADQVRIVDYPHFISSAIHNNYVDCVRFWGDVLFSKAAEEHKIVVWQITGFNSALPPPDSILAPKASEYLDTRNGFTRALVTTEGGVTKIITQPVYATTLLYKRLLEFSNADCGLYFMRFDVLKQTPEHPDIHAVLACGNERSELRLWDLEAIERGYDDTPRSSGTGSGGRGRRRKRSRRGAAHTGLPRGNPGRSRLLDLSKHDGPSSISGSRPSVGPSSRASSPGSTDDSWGLSEPPLSDDAAVAAAAATTTAAPIEPPADRTRFPLRYHNIPLTKAHRTVDLRGVSRTHKLLSRAAAWSPDGRWCVVAGESLEEVPIPEGTSGGAGAKGKGRKKEYKTLRIGAAVILERNLP